MPDQPQNQNAANRRYPWAAVGWLWLVCFLKDADRPTTSSVLPLLQPDFGFDAVHLGWIGSAFAWVYAALAPLAGLAADRFSRNRLIQKAQLHTQRRGAVLESKTRALEGILPPLMTPLAARDQLDVAGLERLVRRVIGGGVQGVFILGTSSQAPALSDRLRREVIRRVCRQVKISQLPTISGVKDSSGDRTCSRALIDLCQVRPDWGLFIGPEHLLVESLRRGGHGGVNGGAQIDPQLFVNLFEAVRRHDEPTVKKRHRRLLKLGRIYRVCRHASAGLKGMKCALSLLGMCQDRMAEPFTKCEPVERAKIRRVLEELKLLE